MASRLVSEPWVPENSAAGLLFINCGDVCGVEGTPTSCLVSPGHPLPGGVWEWEAAGLGLLEPLG